MEYESDDIPMVYFYEVDVNDDRFALRAIEIFVDRTVNFYNDLYCDVVEACPIPTVDEWNEKVWGEGFYAAIISKDKFDKIWNTGIYNESLTDAWLLVYRGVEYCGIKSLSKTTRRILGNFQLSNEGDAGLSSKNLNYTGADDGIISFLHS